MMEHDPDFPERIDPAQMGPDHEQTQYHLARYKVAATFMPSQGLILDLACGTGYGSILLNQVTGCQVLGVDHSWAAIQLAKRAAGESNGFVQFREADLMKWGTTRKAQGLVCLETIEHLTDPQTFLSKVCTFLDPGARVCLSAPVLDRGTNPWHRHIFNQDQLLGLFKDYFELEAVFDQIKYQMMIGRL